MGERRHEQTDSAGGCHPGAGCEPVAGRSPATRCAADVPETRGGAIEEVIVTAQRREQDLQQIPISVAVFDEAALAARNIGDVGDIGIMVPNLRMAAFPYSPTTIRLFIRGVGSNETQVTQDPSVGVYKDGIYIGRSAGLSMDIADLERVEILRGPQGTLYGRNTTGGAVNLVTAPPTGEFGIKQEIGAGNLGYWKTRTLLDLPAWGNLSAKCGYLQSSRDGLVENSGEGPTSARTTRKARSLRCAGDRAEISRPTTRSTGRNWTSPRTITRPRRHGTRDRRRLRQSRSDPAVFRRAVRRGAARDRPRRQRHAQGPVPAGCSRASRVTR